VKCPQCGKRPSDLPAKTARQWDRELCPRCFDGWHKPPTTSTSTPRCGACGNRTTNLTGDRCTACTAHDTELISLFDQETTQ